MINRIKGLHFGDCDKQEHLRPYCLKACPFCAEVGDLLDIYGTDQDGVWWCTCNSCGTDGPYSEELKEAVRMWNSRKRPDIGY